MQVWVSRQQATFGTSLKTWNCILLCSGCKFSSFLFSLSTYPQVPARVSPPRLPSKNPCPASHACLLISPRPTFQKEPKFTASLICPHALLTSPTREHAPAGSFCYSQLTNGRTKSHDLPEYPPQHSQNNGPHFCLKNQYSSSG